VNTPNLLDQALAALNSGQTPTAIEYAEAAYRQHPADVAVLNILGACYMRGRRYDAAIERFLSATRIEPQNAALHLNLGAAYQKNGEIELATQNFATAHALEPANPLTRAQYAESLFTLGRYTEALAHFSALASDHPQRLDAWRGLGHVYFQQGDFSQAATCYQRALQIAPQDGVAQLNLAFSVIGACITQTSALT